MKIKKLLSLLAVAVMTVTASNLIYGLAEDKTLTGKCGNNAEWSFDETTGVLTISGTGDMYTKYVPYDQWEYYQYKDEITEVVVEEGITYISECAFGPFDPNFTLYREPPIYSKLTKLTLPSSVKSIGKFAFYKTALKSVTLPEGLEKIGDGAFSYTSLSGDLNLPKSLNSIGEYAFSNTNISSANLNEGMILGGCAFRDCDFIKEVIIPNDLKYILTYASNAGRPNCGFAQCDLLEKVIIQGAGTVEIGQSKNSHKNAIGEGLFLQCLSLKEVELETEDIEYVSSETFDMTNNPTFKVYKGSTTEQTLKDAGYLTAENTVYYDVDTTELEDAIAKAKNIDTSKFTAESVSQFNKAVAEAQALLNQEYLLPSVLNETIKSLNDAISALVEKSPEPSNDSSDNNTNSTSNTLNKTPKAASAKTDAEKITSNINQIKKAKIKKITVKNISKKKIKVTWKKVNKAKGYQVQVSKKKNFKKKLFNKYTSKEKLIFSKKLKIKKIYYVRVRAYYIYRDRNNEIQNAYSKWSKKLKVKIK